MDHNLTLNGTKWTQFPISKWYRIKLKPKVVVNETKISRRKWPKFTVRCFTFPFAISLTTTSCLGVSKLTWFLLSWYWLSAVTSYFPSFDVQHSVRSRVYFSCFKELDDNTSRYTFKLGWSACNALIYHYGAKRTKISIFCCKAEKSTAVSITWVSGWCSTKKYDNSQLNWFQPRPLSSVIICKALDSGNRACWGWSCIWKLQCWEQHLLS